MLILFEFPSVGLFEKCAYSGHPLIIVSSPPLVYRGGTEARKFSIPGGGQENPNIPVVVVVVGTPSAGIRRLSSLSTLSLSFHSTRNGGLETPTPDVGGWDRYH